MDHYKALSQKFGYPIIPDESYFNSWAQWLIKYPATLKNGIDLLKMNTANYPSSPRAFMALGAAYTKNGEKQKAITAYKKAGALDPASDEIKLRLKELQNNLQP
ncbi:tetratricopeptide repeat protein [Pedobacter sp.]|uniref:tetratricopeptide repeat protein n=1 Tax=Pedobacter sp. TaxID=1411316 RepID=UPI0031E11B6B